MRHAVVVGPEHDTTAVRAIIAAAVNNSAHGFSGLGLEVVDRLLALLVHDCIPEVPALGSVRYLAHITHIALVLIREGTALARGRRLSGADALKSMRLAPVVLGAKE